MFGLSRRKSAHREEHAEPVTPPPAFEISEEEVGDTLHQSFRVLEIATLTLDSIAHGLSEARSLARSAARPDGAAQRGLIAARYAFLKDDIEHRSAEQALSNGDQIAIALGAPEDSFQGSLMTRNLPSCAFATAEEARALAAMMDEALRAVDEEASRIRDAAGHVADRIVQAAATAKPEASPKAAAPAAKPAPARGRRAA